MKIILPCGHKVSSRLAGLRPPRLPGREFVLMDLLLILPIYLPSAHLKHPNFQLSGFGKWGLRSLFFLEYSLEITEYIFKRIYYIN